MLAVDDELALAPARAETDSAAPPPGLAAEVLDPHVDGLQDTAAQPGHVLHERQARVVFLERGAGPVPVDLLPRRLLDPGHCRHGRRRGEHVRDQQQILPGHLGRRRIDQLRQVERLVHRPAGDALAGVEPLVALRLRLARLARVQQRVEVVQRRLQVPRRPDRGDRDVRLRRERDDPRVVQHEAGLVVGLPRPRGQIPVRRRVQPAPGEPVVRDVARARQLLERVEQRPGSAPRRRRSSAPSRRCTARGSRRAAGRPAPRTGSGAGERRPKRAPPRPPARRDRRRRSRSRRRSRGRAPSIAATRSAGPRVMQLTEKLTATFRREQAHARVAVTGLREPGRGRAPDDRQPPQLAADPPLRAGRRRPPRARRARTTSPARAEGPQVRVERVHVLVDPEAPSPPPGPRPPRSRATARVPSFSARDDAAAPGDPRHLRDHPRRGRARGAAPRRSRRGRTRRRRTGRCSPSACTRANGPTRAS